MGTSIFSSAIRGYSRLRERHQRFWDAGGPVILFSAGTACLSCHLFTDMPCRGLVRRDNERRGFMRFV